MKPASSYRRYQRSPAKKARLRYNVVKVSYEGDPILFICSSTRPGVTLRDIFREWIRHVASQDVSHIVYQYDF